MLTAEFAAIDLITSQLPPERSFRISLVSA